jgi:tetratricopeptide (TPR) repeat protein
MPGRCGRGTSAGPGAGGSKRADPETLAVHYEAAGEPEKAGRFYAIAAAEAARALAFDRAAKLYRRALELGPGDDAGARALRISLADALANSGRGVDAAQEYLAAAAGASPAEVLGLKQRAGYQLLISGHVDLGLQILDTVLESMGLRLPVSPKRALVRLLVNRAILRVRGLRFRSGRPAGSRPRSSAGSTSSGRSPWG